MRGLVERLELVGLHRRLVLVHVAERVLSAVVVSVIVRVDGLGLEARNGVKLLDRSRTKASQSTEYGPLDLRHLSVFHGVHERVLGLRRVVLKLLCGVFLSEGCNLVKVCLEVVRHLFRQFLAHIRGMRLRGDVESLGSEEVSDRQAEKQEHAHGAWVKKKVPSGA